MACHSVLVTVKMVGQRGEGGGSALALDISVHSEASLVHFGSDVDHGPEQQWHLEQIRPFLENPDSTGPSLIARYYPNVSRHRDQRVWRGMHLEYGILELLPGLVGREWPTFPGHLHRGPGRTPFPAVMEVIHGDGALYLQRSGPFDQIQEATLIWLSPHDRVLLPPGYIHVLINRGAGPLVVAEAHSTDTRAEFDDVARHRGAGYYLGPDGARPNSHYRRLRPLRVISATLMAPPAATGLDLYHMILGSPERFQFLHPL